MNKRTESSEEFSYLFLTQILAQNIPLRIFD